MKWLSYKLYLLTEWAKKRSLKKIQKLEAKLIFKKAKRERLIKEIDGHFEVLREEGWL